MTVPTESSCRVTSLVVRSPFQKSSSTTGIPSNLLPSFRPTLSVPFQDCRVCVFGLLLAKSSVGLPRALLPAGGFRSFLCVRLARRKEEFAAHDKRYLPPEKRVASLEFEAQSLLRQNQALRQNVTGLKADFLLRTAEAASLTRRLTDLDSRATATPAKLSAFISERDRYHLRLSSLSHHFDFLQTSLCRVVADSDSDSF